MDNTTEMTSVHMKMETDLHNSRLQSSVRSMLSEQCSVFRDVRMIMRDGVMFLDIPSTAVIFPHLGHQLDSVAGVGTEVTLIMKDYSITDIRNIILNSNIVKTTSEPVPDDDPAEEEDDKMYEDTTEDINDNSDNEEEEVEVKEEQNDTTKIIQFASAPSLPHPLDSVDRKVETPGEGMIFDGEKEAIEFLYFFCKQTNTPVVKYGPLVRGEFSQWKDVTFQCAFGHKASRKTQKKQRFPYVKCPWAVSFRTEIGTSEGKRTSVTRVKLCHENHEQARGKAWGRVENENMFEKNKKTILRYLEQIEESKGQVKPRKAERLFCVLCDKSFSSKGSLLTHNRYTHDNEKPKFFCDQCDYVGYSKQRLTDHIKAKHENYVVQCDLCPFTTFSDHNLKLHKMRNHEQGAIYICDQCDYKSKVHEQLKRHKKSNHGVGEMIQCDQCEYRSVSSTNIKKHISAVHDKIRKFSCPYCPHNTTWRHCIHKHIRKCHKDKVAEFGDNLADHGFNDNRFNAT